MRWAVDDLEKAQWEKLVWNVPFNGLGVAALAGVETMVGCPVPEEISRRDCFPSDELLVDSRWAELARGLMLGVTQAAAKLGHTILDVFAGRMIERTRTMGTCCASMLLISSAAGRWNSRAFFSNRCARHSKPGLKFRC